MNKGIVKDPSTDRRLKENRGKFPPGPQRAPIIQGGQGRVKDPAKDKRLKQNRGKS
ncbi:MAG: hypothetical protein KGL39_49015 [Patescibacteria group bacterium]|nr:hypothetical protein [Patescibacteria group bacterium]